MRRTATAAALALAVVATLPATLEAQEIGLKLGGSMAKTDLSAEGIGIDPDSRFGLAGGGFIRFPFGPLLSLQAELLYAQKGFEIAFEDEDLGEFDIGFHLDYVEIPLLLRIALPTGPMLSPYVLMGPAVALEASCKSKVEFSGLSASVDCDETDPETGISADTKSVDVGAALGGGVAFPMGPGSLSVEGRYTFGLVDINDIEGADAAEMKNRAWYFLAGFSIPLLR